MPKYMINICYGDLEKRKQFGESPDAAKLMSKYQEWSKKIAAKTLVAHKLKEGSGKKLELHGGQVKDGPFVETKETIGGFYIVETSSYDEASKLASDCPTLLYQGGYIEIREVEF